MNNNSQEKADFDGFVFLKDDAPNLFDQANQAANSQMPAAAIPFVMESAPATTPGASQEVEIPMSLDVNAFIQGFADVEQGSSRRCVNPYLSAVSSASAMDPVPPQSVNPYIDHLAQMQQFNGMTNASMQEDINVFPNQP